MANRENNSVRSTISELITNYSYSGEYIYYNGSQESYSKRLHKDKNIADSMTSIQNSLEKITKMIDGRLTTIRALAEKYTNDVAKALQLPMSATIQDILQKLQSYTDDLYKLNTSFQQGTQDILNGKSPDNALANIFNITRALKGKTVDIKSQAKQYLLECKNRMINEISVEELQTGVLNFIEDRYKTLLQDAFTNVQFTQVKQNGKITISDKNITSISNTLQSSFNQIYKKEQQGIKADLEALQSNYNSIIEHWSGNKANLGYFKDGAKRIKEILNNSQKLTFKLGTMLELAGTDLMTKIFGTDKATHVGVRDQLSGITTDIEVQLDSTLPKLGISWKSAMEHLYTKKTGSYLTTITINNNGKRDQENNFVWEEIEELIKTNSAILWYLIGTKARMQLHNEAMNPDYILQLRYQLARATIIKFVLGAIFLRQNDSSNEDIDYLISLIQEKSFPLFVYTMDQPHYCLDVINNMQEALNNSSKDSWRSSNWMINDKILLKLAAEANNIREQRRNLEIENRWDDDLAQCMNNISGYLSNDKIETILGAEIQIYTNKNLK